MNVAYIQANTDHRVFVISSWLDSFRDCDSAGMISMGRFFDCMWPEVEELLNRRGSRTVVAINKDDPSQYFGFIAGDPTASPPLVYYVLVKAAVRRWGIARSLFRALGIDPSKQFDYAYKTPLVSTLAHKVPLASHQPMLARFPLGMGRRRIAR